MNDKYLKGYGIAKKFIGSVLDGEMGRS